MSDDYTYYNLTLDVLKNSDILENYIYPNMNLNYYWTDDWSVELYTHLAYHGFITVSSTISNVHLLMPEIQFSYAVLNFKDLYICKNVQKLLHRKDFLDNEYHISINKNFDQVVKNLNSYHFNNWLTDKYVDLINNISKAQTLDHKIDFLSVELYSKKTNTIIAGELGYSIGSTYTSLTGFCNKTEKKYSNFGKLQLVCLCKLLEKHGYSFWNLGHPYMNYKIELGAKILERPYFLEIWKQHRDKTPMQTINSKHKLDYSCFELLNKI
jgi:Leu/Phe-tRNA-protein transferase